MVNKLREAIILKAEEEALKIKEDAKKEIREKEKENLKKIKKEVDILREKMLREADEEMNEYYFKKLYEIKKNAMMEKQKILEEISENLISMIINMSDKDKEEIYSKIYSLVKDNFGDKGVVYCSKNDEELVKRIFKSMSVKSREDIDFGVVVETPSERVDFSLNGLKDAIKVKIEEMLL